MKLIDFYSGAILFAVVASVTSCVEKKFEKSVWSAKGDIPFTPVERAEMLDDVLSTYKLVGMRYTGVIDLLGRPDGTHDSSVFYKIEIDYGADINPVYTKDLYLFVGKDSIVTSYEIREWGMR